jgi:hypothetical protein
MTNMTVGNSREYGAAKPQCLESLRNRDASWRAGRSLCVGRIYLYDKALLKMMVMKRLTNACRLVIVAWLATTVFGCQTLQSHPGLTIVPIASFNQLVGKWEGISKHVPDMKDDAYVVLIIGGNGYFNFVGNRATGYLLGTGTLTLLDGRAHGKTRSGTGTVTLHDKAGSPVLVVEVSLNDGHHFYIEMTPLRG